MSNRKFKNLYFGILGSLLLCMAVPAQAIFMELTPNDLTAQTGDTFELDLMVLGLGDFQSESLGDFDIDIGFDTSALSLTDWTLGNFLGDIGLGDAFDFSSGDLGGVLNLSVVSFLSTFDLNSQQPGAFSLATLTFDVLDLEPGNATMVSIDSVFAVGDEFGNALPVDGIGNATIINPSVSIPEPGTLVLLSLGLFVLCWSRRAN